ncbi:MAG TPA: hypothetical protein VF381_11965 [Thermoanaerobaculia bacterium]
MKSRLILIATMTLLGACRTIALTHHPNGDQYIEELARQVDDVMQR